MKLKLHIIALFVLVALLSAFGQNDAYITRGIYSIDKTENTYILEIYNKKDVKVYFEYSQRQGLYYLCIKIIRNVNTELNTVDFELNANDMNLYGKIENQLKFSLDGNQAVAIQGNGGREYFVLRKTENREGYVNEYRIELPNYKALLFLKAKELNCEINVGVNEIIAIKMANSDIAIIKDFGLIMDSIGLR